MNDKPVQPKITEPISMDWEDSFDEMWSRDFVQYKNGGAYINLDPGKYKVFIRILLAKEKQKWELEQAGKED